jgi:hypothetical protein
MAGGAQPGSDDGSVQGMLTMPVTPGAKGDAESSGVMAGESANAATPVSVQTGLAIPAAVSPPLATLVALHHPKSLSQADKRPDVPVRVQIVQAIGSGGAQVTELRLAPEELGHVRIDMRHEGERLVMVVSAERPETLDLLRRHAPDLVADLRTTGHQGLDLSFGRWSGPSSDERTAAVATDEPTPTDPVRHNIPTAQEPGHLLPANGLYLRI